MVRRGILGSLTLDQRSAFVQRDEVKGFIERVRQCKAQTRNVTGAELEIPDIVLELLRDNLHRYSKLIGKVRLKPVNGTGRQTIAGTIPEGIWTEAIASLNELNISFNQIEVDGYKVGGFIPVPNSTLEDTDINLASEIIDSLGQAIGFAVDKAILYGTGAKMPIGIVTRLAQGTQPSNWGTNAPKWENLATTNVRKFAGASLEGAAFFAKLIKELSYAKANYSSGEKFWCMNSTTKADIMSKAITFNASGALVASQTNTMPIIGGDIIELEFIPDNEIIGGYGSLYLLAERKGGQFAVSDQVKFIEDQTVFKGTARYDGTPVIGKGFVAVNYNNAAVTTSVTFPADKANTVATQGA